jgi:chromosome segregation ATPase
MNTPTEIIIKALRVLVDDIQSPDGVPNACVAQAADRLEELQRERDKAFAEVERLKEQVNGQVSLCTKLTIERGQLWAEVERVKNALHDALAEISRLEKMTPVISRTVTRPEPSRLEIAAMLMAAWEANPEIERARFNQSNRVDLWSSKLAIEEADALIAASREAE